MRITAAAVAAPRSKLDGGHRRQSSKPHSTGVRQLDAIAPRQGARRQVVYVRRVRERLPRLAASKTECLPAHFLRRPRSTSWSASDGARPRRKGNAQDPIPLAGTPGDVGVAARGRGSGATCPCRKAVGCTSGRREWRWHGGGWRRFHLVETVPGRANPCWIADPEVMPVFARDEGLPSPREGSNGCVRTQPANPDETITNAHIALNAGRASPEGHVLDFFLPATPAMVTAVQIPALDAGNDAAGRTRHAPPSRPDFRPDWCEVRPLPPRRS